MGAHDNGSGHARQVRHMNAETLVGAAALNFAQEDNILAVFLHADAVVDDTAQPAFQFAQFMVVRRKQRLCADFLFVHQVFHNCPRDAQAVKRTRSTSDFIEYNQRFRCCAPQNVRHLVHFHHKRRLAARQIVGCADTGKNAIHNSDFSAFRRNKTAHMRHQRDKRHLTHISALARHVRASNDEHAVIFIVEQRTVGHKLFVTVHARLDHRMTAILNIDYTVFRNFRPNIAVLHRSNRQRNQRVERLEPHRRMLNARNLRGKELSDFDKQPLFQPNRLFLCAEHGFLNFMQFRRHIAFTVGQRLLSCVAIRHLLIVGLRHFNVVAEHAIILNFEILDARQLSLFGLQIGNPLMAVS